jgi:5-oxoprolinase (ATP-hydrolysing)
MTDPEVLERRYPVRVRAHRIREGSGGDGVLAGGDGSVRQLEFLESMEVALLSSHRREPPAGLAGGGDAACGTQRLIRAEGDIVSLEGLFSVKVEPGDIIEIATPGGGGFGDP